MEINYKALGKRIKLARIEKELTQEKLAEQVGLSPTHMSNIESGTVCPPWSTLPTHFPSVWTIFFRTA